MGAAGGTDAGSGGAGAGGTGGGSAGKGGGAGNDGDLSSPTWVLCRSWLSMCDTPYAAPATCQADYFAAYRGVPSECRSAAIDYLYCGGYTSDCASGVVDPPRCAEETEAFADCLFGDQPGCDLTVLAEVEGCTLATSCNGTTTEVQCDGENDGSGTSLCSCTRNGGRVGDPASDGIGLLACANAARQCGF